MDWKPRHISVTGDGLTARVVLDDTDISRHVQGYNIEGRPGQLPLVVLYAHPNAGSTFDGEAHIAVADQTNPADAITGFLTTIDPVALERAALDRPDLGNGKGDLTRAMLAQLADWAKGNT
ncbi:hypothetical protein HY68_36945 [Streptomyces sp. AcH 505]|nr:hypothetical protein HY68_36945 [Streptomyces sp. AcH 505]